MTDWQPIETAPFEEYVFVCCPGWKHVVYACRDESEPDEWMSFNGYYEYIRRPGEIERSGRRLTPSLWMRPIAPPEVL